MPTFQPATLHAPKGGTWRFIWYNVNPRTACMERVRPTLNINRIRDLAERQRLANEWVAGINEALKNGYNYFVHTLGYQAPAGMLTDTPQAAPAVLDRIGNTIIPAGSSVTITDALNSALKIRLLGMKDRTRGTYTSFVTTLTAWLEENKLHDMPVTAFSADHFQRYLEYKNKQGHGNRNLNDHTNFFKTTFDEVRKKLKLISENPIQDFDYLPETESSLFEPLTNDEIERIVPVLYGFNPRYYLYTRFIALEMIRPYHIAWIKAPDILYNADVVRIEGANTKNRKNKKKQLMQSIKEMLIGMEYHKLPADYYLFGKNISTPERGVGAGKKRGEAYSCNFEPSPILHMHLSKRAANVWRELVIKGLGINKKMYALKHTSSQYYVNENDNADLMFLQAHMEHSSFAQTEIYLQNKVEKRINEGKTKMINY